MKANFDETAKADADDMVENLRASFKELVTETDWMDSETQGKAITKADQMLQLIGYPDWLVDVAAVDAYYSTAPVTSEQDHLGNVLATDHWAAIQDLITLRAKPERDIWLMHPAIVNAWYSPNHNTISKSINTTSCTTGLTSLSPAFPAGILQAPFFKGGWPRYLNYGAMGMVSILHILPSTLLHPPSR